MIHIYRVRTGMGFPARRTVPSPARAALFGRRCRTAVTGPLGSARGEFEDGTRVVTSRRAVTELRQEA